jgi:hypothetical protein
MKNLFLFLFFVAYASFAIAQENDSTSVKRKNVFKFLPVNIPFQSNSFEYERMINAKNSFTLGIGLANQQSLLGKYGIDSNSDIQKAELGTSHIRVAFRHYGGGKRNLPRGFYIEPYVKYQNITGKASISGTVDQNQPYQGNLDINLTTMNFGFQLGAQFLIAKRVTLDFYFFGLEAGVMSGNVTATSDQLSQVDNLKSKVEDAISNLPPFIGDKLTVTQPTSSQINVKASSVPYPWLRGGISIGIAF